MALLKIRANSAETWRLARLSSCLVWIILFLFLADTAATGQTVGEYQVKAAFLFNFAKFVEWPQDVMEAQPEAILICVLGQSPFGQALQEATNGKTIGGRRLVVRYASNVHQSESCHILFICSSERKNLPVILEAIRTSSTLTVGEGEGFAADGGMIGFKLEDGKVRFEINVDAVEQRRLRISSKLLNLAQIVRNPKGRSR